MINKLKSYLFIILENQKQNRQIIETIVCMVLLKFKLDLVLAKDCYELLKIYKRCPSIPFEYCAYGFQMETDLLHT